MPLLNPSTTASWLALLAVYFLWSRLSAYDREPKPVRVYPPVGPAPHSLDGGA